MRRGEPNYSEVSPEYGLNLYAFGLIKRTIGSSSLIIAFIKMETLKTTV